VGRSFVVLTARRNGPGYDTGEERQWRQLDSCQYNTVLKQRIDNIVTYCTHGIITNSMAEGINTKIMSTQRRAGDYRNIENVKKAIIFYRGGLDLYSR
jgi:hypothetical protein